MYKFYFFLWYENFEVKKYRLAVKDLNNQIFHYQILTNRF